MNDDPGFGQMTHHRHVTPFALVGPAGIIGDEVQALTAQDPGPADPLLPCLTLVSGSLPAEDRYPAIIQSGHVAQGTSRHRAEAAVMMRLHQGIPAFPLCGQDNLHLNAVQVILLV